MPIANYEQEAKDKAAVLALLNDVAESEHALRHKAGWAALLGMLQLEWSGGRTVVDPVDEERKAREAALQAAKDAESKEG